MFSADHTVKQTLPQLLVLWLESENLLMIIDL